MNSALELFVSKCRYLQKKELALEFENLIAQYNNDVGKMFIDISSNFKDGIVISSEESKDIIKYSKSDIITSILQATIDLNIVTESIIKSKDLDNLIDLFASLSNTKSISLLLESFLEAINLDLIDDNIISVIIQKAILYIHHSDLSLSELSCKITESILIKYDTQKYMNILMDASSKNSNDSTLYMRYLSIMSKILSSGNNQFNACLSHGAVEIIITLCQSNQDILVQILALELLVNFASTEQGLDYLFSKDIIKWLIASANGLSSGSNDPIIGTEALRIIGDIFLKASLSSISLEPYLSASQNQIFVSDFLRAAILHVEATNENDRLAGIRALSDFASSSYFAFNVVLSDIELIDAWLSLLNSKVEIQAAILHSISIIFESDNIIPSESIDNFDQILLSIRDKKINLFKKIGNMKRIPTVDYLLKMCKQPIQELRAGSYHLMSSIIQQSDQWGINTFTSSNDFIFFIKDRNTEFSKQGKEWKFSVIKSLWDNKKYLDSEIIPNIQRMINEGPYFVPSSMGELQTI